MPNISLNSNRSCIITGIGLETGISIGPATGFFGSYKDRLYLITNRHVISGCHRQSKKNICNGATVGSLMLTINGAEFLGGDKFKPKKFRIHNIPLYEKKGDALDTSKPLRIEHPEYGNDVDIAVIDITENVGGKIEEIVVYDLDKCFNEILETKVMQEVFIIGYPLKTEITPNQFPIYKRGSIASEPDVNKGPPLFYIDGKTKSGMSGSPVILKNDLIIDKSKPGKISFNDGKLDLVGVYSGRERKEDEYTAELGICWKIKLVKEIIDGGE